MSNKPAERDLVALVVKHLVSDGYQVVTEVPTLGKSADIVAIKDEKYTIVEVKVNKIKKALEQCKAHELVADYILIALGTKSISESARRAVSGRGYGLIHCVVADNACNRVVEPTRNTKYWLPQRQVFANRFQEIADGY